eukprot:TRINITY_DN27945_c0_g1_i1.p1 TRINITY_DN27945_c0_g1~~TRINITY_DN27945_c0_g1_i1.p1  ORF type:complete len:274 (+),score=48.20 TRINITY_DN27945_c0_g1_i1:113-934(+)
MPGAAPRAGTPRSGPEAPDTLGVSDLASVLSPDHLEMLELCRSWKAELEGPEEDGAIFAQEYFLQHHPNEQQRDVFETFKEAGKRSHKAPAPDAELGDSAPVVAADVSPPSPRPGRGARSSGPPSMPTPSWSPTPSTRSTSAFSGSPPPPSSPRSPRQPLTPEQQQREDLQLRQAELELELSPAGAEQLVPCQVSPTSWLQITQRAANDFQSVNNLVRDARQLMQQKAAFEIERHRHLVAAHLGEPVSYTHLRAHETPEHLVCRLLLEKKKQI